MPIINHQKISCPSIVWRQWLDDICRTTEGRRPGVVWWQRKSLQGGDLQAEFCRNSLVAGATSNSDSSRPQPGQEVVSLAQFQR